ncbi:ATP-grasp domain-containing protein [Yinghuangia soli]|uniref:ATP-grasp domain-containing protein n=1 Tax=Yinghuangia soli TaxID=2908204 RepID=A0AA41Q6G9_9ACTN|nr:ATP-grasp domain-containing protein [Yinghuangia soli]MCF2531576.1 ATP-grasp domain-containing protein [Yinghuangia soli]
MTTQATAPDPRVLVLAPRSTDTDRRLVSAAHRRGLRAERLTGWTVPADLAGTPGLRAHVYAGPLFADAVAADLALGLLEAPEDWLARLPEDLTGRRITAATLAEAWELRRPAFVKPPNDKSFAARVYRDGTQLPGPDAADPDTAVLISDAVAFRSEYRLFVLDGEVRAASRYAVDGDLAIAPIEDCAEQDEVLAFAAHMLAAQAAALPSAVVVDVGRLDGFGWAVVEANAAWASGGYACDLDRILDVILRAGGPLVELPPHDRPFVRPAPTVVR